MRVQRQRRRRRGGEGGSVRTGLGGKGLIEGGLRAVAQPCLVRATSRRTVLSARCAARWGGAVN